MNCSVVFSFQQILKTSQNKTRLSFLNEKRAIIKFKWIFLKSRNHN
jgi:hypothetical protein